MELTAIKGVTEKRKEELNKSNINCVEDLIKNFPRNYLDMRKITPLKYSYHNERVLTVAKIISLPSTFVSARKTKYVKAVCSQGDDVFTAVWFNQPYVLGKLKEGEEYFFFGRVQNTFSQTSLINPTFERTDNNVKLKGIIPVYLFKGNLYQSVYRQLVVNALSTIKMNSVIPQKLQIKYDLMPLLSAYVGVHAPVDTDGLRFSAERIAIEEYFELISAFRIIKGDGDSQRVNRYDVTATEIVEFTKRFGFEFTNGQKKAVNEIYTDLRSEKTMNRLLQGDVGSGKTAVAVTSMYFAVKSGYQTAFLAPTEVLAKQNYAICKKYFTEYEVVFLSGSSSAKEKKEIKSQILSGKAKIIVGTHAVLEENVVFDNLALCVCDEQHRFGVSQRSSLLSKGVKPDLLVMSATPIPRTLALIFYGDLDVSTIQDKPKARAEIKTHIVPMRKYEDMLGFVMDNVRKGRQAYFVAPKIEGDDEGTVMSVTELYKELQATLTGAKLCLLHGKMKDKEKNEIMQEFKQGNIDVLVSTTVIEVGIDVPNANVMVIYNAERFGLSQLHQLRGRVGRSNIESYCFLLSESDSEKSMDRLRIMQSSSDGFKIAEYDYEQRGAGDFLGTRQSGKFITDLGNLQYPISSIFTAKKIADEVFESGEDLTEIRRIAIEKYDKLKDISLN